MKYRYLSVFLLVLILAIGAVSAQDDASDVDVISAASDDVISVDSNVDILQNESETQEIHLNNANFADYFDENGTLNSNVSEHATIYAGDLTNKSLFINKNVNVLPDNSSNIVDSTFFFVKGSEGSTIKGLNITNDFVAAIGIMHVADISVLDNAITILGNANRTAIGLFIMGGANANVTGNYITYNGKNDGENLTCAVSVIDCPNTVFEENVFDINIPSAPIDWQEIPAGSGDYVAFPRTEGIAITASNNFVFKRNSVFVNATDMIGLQQDTIYVMNIVDSNNTIVESNDITALGHSYIYGIVISSQDFNISDNTVSVESDTYYANGIDVEGPASGVVENNTIIIAAPTAAYPIYSGMSNGDIEVEYNNNEIYADAFVVYGMELTGSDETVFKNEFYLYGNYTTGIASKSKTSRIEKNNIRVNGTCVGNVSDYWDAFDVYTVGINLYNSSATVIENYVDSYSVGINVENADGPNFVNNTIIVTNNGKLDSAAFYAENVNNLNFEDNLMYYEGNTDGETLNAVMAIIDSDNPNIEKNIIYGDVLSMDSIWTQDEDGNWVQDIVSYGLVFYGDDDIQIVDNDINVRYIDHIGFLDNIYALDVDSDDALIENNNITVTGYSYTYGIKVSGNEFTVSSNNINITSDINYACGINVEGPASGVVYGNTITVNSPNVAYPVYSGMSNGDMEVEYENNIINALSDIVYGMELTGKSESVSFNNITLNGNFTTGIASRSKNLLVFNNTIFANGTNLGNVTTSDLFAVSTTGINLYNSSATVFYNNISSTSKGLYAYGGDVILVENDIGVYDDAQVSSLGIVVEDANYVNLFGNILVYVGRTNGTNKNVALSIENCNKSSISRNIVLANIVSCDVDWVQDEDGNWVGYPVSSGIVLNNCNSTEVSDNNFTVVYGDHKGYSDTIYAVDVDTDNLLFIRNVIYAEGFSYVYALQISGENFTVSNNNISSYSDSHYANGINVEGTAYGEVTKNTITVEAPTVAYPIYTSMSGKVVVADYLDNIINAEADIVYGMELAGTNETAIGNTITVKGNKTIGIAGKSDNLIIINNKIDALGENLGNTTIWESFKPETTGIKIIGGNANIDKNTIKANGLATVNITNVNATVVYNYLVGNESFGDASVYYENENATVHDNLPDYDAFLKTEDIKLYYKNGTRFVATVTNFLGQPLENEKVEFFINNVSYVRVTDSNGTASIAINLDAGNYTVLTTLWAPGNYTPTQAWNNVTVLTTIEGDDIVKMFRNGTQYAATFLDGQGNPLVNAAAEFNINGVKYIRTTDSKGTARLNINLDPGVYIITATNPVNGENHANNITVLATIASNDLVKYYKNESQFVVTVLDENGNAVGAGEEVIFNINGVFYTRTTNESGQAKLNINLQPGNYTITTMYKNCSVANNVEVKSVLYAEDLVKKYGTSDQFIAYLVDGQGKPFAGETITFNIHGLLYDRITDGDGRAMLNIKLDAAVDTYIITSMYKDTSIANTIKVEP